MEVTLLSDQRLYSCGGHGCALVTTAERRGSQLWNAFTIPFRFIQKNEIWKRLIFSVTVITLLGEGVGPVPPAYQCTSDVLAIFNHCQVRAVSQMGGLRRKGPVTDARPVFRAGLEKLKP